MFTQAYLSFFRNLAANNNVAWFSENKKTYEKEVKKPFEGFIQRLIDDMRQLTPEIMIHPADAIFRINKDVRFSTDKSPYKTEMSAVISKSGKKGNPCPGLYINLGADKAVIASGLKMLEKQELHEVRHHIANHLEIFKEIIENQVFESIFGPIQGEQIKRLPDDLKEAAIQQPLIYNTSFLAITELPADEITQPDFQDKVMEIYRLTLPLSKFLSEPLAA